jgi:hypothetical protein
LSRREAGAALALAQARVPTLVKHYRDELDTATDRAVAAVAGSLFKKAMSETHPQAAACGMFFLKTRGKWRENQTLSIGGDVEAPPVKIERAASTPTPSCSTSSPSWVRTSGPRSSDRLSRIGRVGRRSSAR